VLPALSPHSFLFSYGIDKINDFNNRFYAKPGSPEKWPLGRRQTGRELITMTDYYHWKSPMSVSGRGILSGVQVSTGGCVTTCVITLLH